MQTHRIYCLDIHLCQTQYMYMQYACCEHTRRAQNAQCTPCMRALCVHTHIYILYRPHIIQSMRRHCTRCMDTVQALNAHTCASVRNIALHKNVC